MKLKQVTASTIALLLAAGFLFLVGSYTDNGGLQFAGAMLLVVSLILAINQASGTDSSE